MKKKHRKYVAKKKKKIYQQFIFFIKNYKYLKIFCIKTSTSAILGCAESNIPLKILLKSQLFPSLYGMGAIVSKSLVGDHIWGRAKPHFNIHTD